MKNKLFDAVFLEKPGVDGLTRSEALDLYDMLSENEAYPLEIENPRGESTAIGFITPSASEKLDYDHSRMTHFVGEILGDVNLENENGVYDFQGLRIYLSR